jgi:hypothetical protein
VDATARADLIADLQALMTELDRRIQQIQERGDPSAAQEADKIRRDAMGALASMLDPTKT